MANPQKENGYTAIANELLEAFMTLNLSSHCWRILFCVIRQSYGWNKKTARLTLSQISQFTGIDIRLIPRNLKKLQEKNIILKKGNEYQLQKDYHKWSSSVEMTSAQMSSKQMKTYIYTDVKSSSIQMKPTAFKSSNGNGLRESKDNKYIYKEISQRETLISRLKNYFPDLHYANIPACVPDERIDFFLYLIEQNKINPSKIEDPVRYIQSRKLIIEPFPSLVERDAERERIERDKRLKRYEWERLARIKQENSDEMIHLIRSFMSKLEGSNEVSV